MPPPDEDRRGEILDCAMPTDLNSVISSADRRPGTVAAAEVEEVAGDVRCADDAGGDRLDDVAGLLQRAAARVDIDPRPADRRVVRLAHREA